MKFRNIGDVLLTTPLIKNLKLNFPDAKIDFALNKGTEEMLTYNPSVNKIFIYDRKKIKQQSFFKKISDELKFALDIRKEKYDLIVNLTEGDRGVLISLFSSAKTKIGYKNSNNFLFKKVFDYVLPKQKNRHTLETNLDPLRKLNINIFEKKVEIFTLEENEKKILNIFKENNINEKEFIHIHPVSRWLFKCINDKTMAKIIDYIENEKNIKVVLTASSDKEEVKKINSILSFCKSSPVNLTGQLTLKDTACLNEKAKIFIGVDTAIMHISAANDIPVISFFGPSGAHHWGPWDNQISNSTYLNANGIQTMGKNVVISESRKCQPCGKDGCNGTKISDCLMKIDFEIIKKYINEKIND